MALLKVLSSRSRCFRRNNQACREILQLRQYASSSDDEGQGTGSKKLKEDPKARAEYRSWVENMLTALQAEAEGRGSVQEKDPETSIRPAEEPATGTSQGNLGLSQDAALPDATVQVTPEASSTSSGLGLQGSGLQDGNLGLQENNITKDDEALGYEPAAATGGGIPRRTTVREVAGFMPDSVRGYRELGVSESGDGALLDQGEGHINSIRKFWPGDMYDPEALVATTAKSYDLKPWMRAQVVVKKATNADALRDADFRNVSFLHKFTSEAGNLPPRKVTKLQKKVHTHVMRQIKIARNMALLPHEGKLEELMPLARARRSPSARV